MRKLAAVLITVLFIVFFHLGLRGSPTKSAPPAGSAEIPESMKATRITTAARPNGIGADAIMTMLGKAPTTLPGLKNLGAKFFR